MTDEANVVVVVVVVADQKVEAAGYSWLLMLPMTYM